MSKPIKTPLDLERLCHEPRPLLHIPTYASRRTLACNQTPAIRPASPDLFTLLSATPFGTATRLASFAPRPLSTQQIGVQTCPSIVIYSQQGNESPSHHPPSAQPAQGTRPLFRTQTSP
ncbi:hypothetical protein PMIN06_009103 [Paraphaeosphaeria minitans]